MGDVKTDYEPALRRGLVQELQTAYGWAKVDPESTRSNITDALATLATMGVISEAEAEEPIGFEEDEYDAAYQGGEGGDGDGEGRGRRRRGELSRASLGRGLRTHRTRKGGGPGATRGRRLFSGECNAFRLYDRKEVRECPTGLCAWSAVGPSGRDAAGISFVRPARVDVTRSTKKRPRTKGTGGGKHGLTGDAAPRCGQRVDAPARGPVGSGHHHEGERSMDSCREGCEKGLSVPGAVGERQW